MPSRSVLRFLHASDFRLGQVPYGFGPVPEPLRAKILAAPWESAAAAFQAAIDHQVCFMLLNGDVVPHDAGLGRAVLFLREWFRRLKQHEIAVFWHAPQSHDFARWQACLDWPDNVRFPDPAHPIEPVQRNGHNIAAVSWGPDFKGSASPGFLPATDGGLSIELPDSKESDSAVDYAGTCGPTRMDSVHRGRTQHSPGATCSIRPAETGPRGCSLIEVDHNDCVHISFLETGTIVREPVQLQVPEDAACVQQWVRARLDAAATEDGPLVIRDLRLEAAGPVSSALLLAADPDELRTRLQPTSRGPGSVVASLELTPIASSSINSSTDSCIADFLQLLHTHDLAFDESGARTTRLPEGLSRNELFRKVRRLGMALLS